MTMTRKLAIAALMLWTIVVTVLRAVRTPNDFAEAHWLLDYRFGFVKRGLLGEILSVVASWASVPITERLIAVLSGVAFGVFCATVMALSLRMVHRSGWSTGTVLVALVFLSSPFMVMSAHLVGYYDNVVIVLGVVSVWLLLKGWSWTALCIQVAAIPLHENALLLVWPVFCLAWLLNGSGWRPSRLPALRLAPLCLPALAFILMALAQRAFLPREFSGQFRERLSQFAFIEEKQDALVPIWISTSFGRHFATQRDAFFQRLTSAEMYGLVLPSALAILCFTVSAFRVRDLSAESWVLLGVCLVPQCMHVVAWDTARIWTYSILCAFLSLWVYAERFNAREESSAVRLLCLAALVVNAVVLTPLMDCQHDHFSLRARLVLYAPAILGGLLLLLASRDVPIAERLSLPRGNPEHRRE